MEAEKSEIELAVSLMDNKSLTKAHSAAVLQKDKMTAAGTVNQDICEVVRILSIELAQRMFEA